MHLTKNIFLKGIAILLSGIFTTIAAEAVARDLPLETIALPPGFQISLFTANVPDARSLTAGPPGVLFVGTRRAGAVYAVIDQDQDGAAESVIRLAKGLRSPNGVAYRDGDLFVAEINRIWRFKNIMQHLQDPQPPMLITDQLPNDGWHGWKFIKFGPDGKLYVPIGAPCNVCEREDKRYASILRMDPDDSVPEVFARGVRNTVGFDWHPDTGELWFTDNGRDQLGDNRPPDELNHAPEKGMHFGFPYCHGGIIPDPEFGHAGACQRYEPPALKLGPHVAALGMRFYTGTMFPEEYRQQIFIAEHGSWNRSTKIGYRVMRVPLHNNEPAGYEPFAAGWLQDGKVWGRPVDVLVWHDGSLLVSDDYAGAVYRITYTPSTNENISAGVK